MFLLLCLQYLPQVYEKKNAESSSSSAAEEEEGGEEGREEGLELISPSSYLPIPLLRSLSFALLYDLRDLCHHF